MRVKFRNGTEKEVLIMQNANLRGANLRGAELQNANLQGANLQNAELQNANLQGANLQNAELQNADLQNAELQNANLRWAELQDANLQNADLQNADLQGADLRRADLRGVKNTNILTAITTTNSTTNIIKIQSSRCAVQINIEEQEIICGCFRGSFEEFLKRNASEHADAYYYERLIINDIMNNKERGLR